MWLIILFLLLFILGCVAMSLYLLGELELAGIVTGILVIVIGLCNLILIVTAKGG